MIGERFKINIVQTMDGDWLGTVRRNVMWIFCAERHQVDTISKEATIKLTFSIINDMLHKEPNATKR